ncbi:UNVERIFIED_CONTAM: hypothetical protein Cloal_2603 [Acetivibrio alkalicellulosi]
MQIYFVVTSIIIVLFAWLVLFFFKSNKYINYWTIGTISIGSLLMTINFPQITNFIIERFSNKNNIYIYAYIISIYIILSVLCTIIASLMDNRGKFNTIIRTTVQKIHDLKLKQKFCLDGKIVEYNNHIEILFNKYVFTNKKNQEHHKTNKDSFREDGDATLDYKHSQITELQEEIVYGKNINQKSVDRKENIDTMGLEAKNEQVCLLQDKKNTINKTSTKANLKDKRKEIAKDKYNYNNDISEYEVNKDYFDNSCLVDNKEIIQANLQRDDKIDSKNNIISVIDDIFGFITELDEESQDEGINMSEVEEIMDTSDKIEKKSTGDKQTNVTMETNVKKSKDIFKKTNKVENNEQSNMISNSVFNYMDEAFRLKETGDYEGAIYNYLNALDMQPDDEVVFWIILDICVLYKELGQCELANDILQSYSSMYGQIMEPAIKCEIEKNLL